MLWPFNSFSLSGSPLSRVDEQMEENEFSRRSTGSAVTGPGSVEALQVWLRIFSASFSFSLAVRRLQGLFSSCSEWRRLFVVLHRLVITVASPVTGHGLWGPRASGVSAPGCWNTGSIVVAHGLGCAKPCGIFLDQGSNLCLLHWLPGRRGTPPCAQL